MATDATAQKLYDAIIARAFKAQDDAKLFVKFSATFATTCWASDSGKPVWSCWCPQCKETIAIARTTDKLPHWCN